MTATVIARFASKSQKGKVRTVKLVVNETESFVGCDCPAWVYQKGPRTSRQCKHTQAARSMSK